MIAFGVIPRLGDVTSKIMKPRFPLIKPVVTAILAFGLSSAAFAGDLDSLFAQLAESDAQSAPYLADEIRAKWSASGSAAVDLLLQRGQEAMEFQDFEAAIGHLTACIDHAPEFTQAYQDRAVAYWQAGYVGPAVADLRQVLLAEPRHFDAMMVLAMIQEQLGRTDQALALWDEVARVLPGDPTARDAQARLILGRDGTEL